MASRPKASAQLASKYIQFRKDLDGYCEVGFPQFRTDLYPLRDKGVWSSAEKARVLELAGAGAGRAIQRLCGVGHPMAVEVLGPAEIRPEPCSAKELETWMKALADNFLRGGWAPRDFTALRHSLESGRDIGVSRLADTYAAGSPLFRETINGHLEAAAAAARPR